MEPIRLILTLANNESLKWCGEWIYMGSNYQELRSLKGRIAGSQVSLVKQNKKQISDNRSYFLDWTELQRQSSGDSLYWWMSHIAGRNNMESQFYNYLCQIVALRNWVLAQNDNYQDVLVVCADAFLLRTIQKNMSDICQLDTYKYSWLGLLRDISYGLAHAGYATLLQYVSFVRHYRMAKKTRPCGLKCPSGEVYLIHQCLSDNSFLGDGKTSCSYFNGLPQWLEDQGKQVVALSWFYNVDVPLEDAYRKLRESNALIPEDWLRPMDYVWSLIQSFKSAFSLNEKLRCNGVDCSSLVLRERLLQLGDNSAQFWRYIPMLKRWSCNLDLLITYDHYENMLFEHPIRRTLHDLPMKTYSIGFCHALVSREFLGYHAVRAEWDSLVKPDMVVCNGLIGKKMLTSQGVPDDRIIAGAALRHSIKSDVKLPNNGGDLLILLSLSIDSCIEMLDGMKQHADWINENLGVNVRIKPHPMMKPELLLNKIGWKSLPNGWHWETGNIDEALAEARCCITQMTASAYDAVLAGCIVLPLMSQLHQMDNYLDIFSDDYAELKSVSLDNVPKRIEDIFFTQTEEFNSIFLCIQSALIEGINPINELTLQGFLPKKIEL